MNRSPEDLIARMFFYWPVCWYWRWRYGKSLNSGGTMRKNVVRPNLSPGRVDDGGDSLTHRLD